MGQPVLIDTDMGGDDAMAIALALSSRALSVEAIVTVGGNVTLDQATTNAGRLLAAIDPPSWPMVGVGLDQPDASLADASHVFAVDGFGRADLPPCETLETHDYRDVYRELAERHAGELQVVAIGPLTNLAALLTEEPDVLRRIGRITVMGGAVFAKGNVTETAEFNFYRDPEAAAAVMTAGLPTALVPLDLTRQVVFDDSHLAHLTASGTRVGDFLSAVLPYAINADADLPPGRTLVHDALAVGCILWPQMFIRTSLGLEIELSGKARGQSRPVVGADDRRVSVLTAVDAMDFLKNLLEVLCQESFVV